MSVFEIGNWVGAEVGSQPTCFGQTTETLKNIGGAGYAPNYVDDMLLGANEPSMPQPAPKPLSFDL